jgi:Mrp family chromosome partitioning ATPase
LASFTDGVVLVVSAGRVPHDVVRRAASQIEAVKGRILGVVINNVNLKRDGYYYDYYRYYQSYYAPADGKKR